MTQDKGQTRSLADLTGRVSKILQLKGDLRGEFILIALQESPTQAYEKAFDLACEHFDARTARDFAKTVRFLAIILRDYGLEKFKEVVE